MLPNSEGTYDLDKYGQEAKAAMGDAFNVLVNLVISRSVFFHFG